GVGGFIVSGYGGHGGTDDSDLVTDPRRNQRQARDRRGRRVDQVGQLFARDAKLVGDRSHGVADDQRVRVVVEEDGNAEDGGGQLAVPRRLRPLDHVPDNPLHSAIASDDAYHSADH